MTAFTADLPMLQEILDRIALFERTLDARLDALDARARRVRSAWNGVASDEYAAAHAAWAIGMRESQAALTSLRRIAATAHGNYSQAVSANLAMWP